MKKRIILFAGMIIILLSLKGYANSNEIYINTRSIKLINDHSVWLTGSIDNWNYVSEYGFAVSPFPFPPLEDQTVTHYEVEGTPLHNNNFTYLLSDLEADKYFFVAAYYKRGSKYYYADNHSFSTGRSIKVSLPVLNIETKNKQIEVPISFSRTVPVLVADITIEYDGNKLVFQDLVSKGIDQFYRKSILQSGSGSRTTVNIKWCAESEFSLEDIALNFLFELKSGISSSGSTSLAVTATFLNGSGQRLAVQTVDGAVNYQHRLERQNYVDKNFGDDDLVYVKDRLETEEQISIKHFTQLRYARWQQAQAFFHNNKRPIEIIQNYYVPETKPADKRPVYEEVVLNLLGSQKKDLISANAGLRYTSPYAVSLNLTSDSIQQLPPDNSAWNLTIAPLSELELSSLDLNGEIVSAWRIDIGLNSAVEIKFPLAKNESSTKLRIRAIYQAGHQFDLVPDYVTDIEDNAFACINAVPNAIFVLYQQKSRIFKSQLGSSQFTEQETTYDIDAATYLSDQSNLMIPLAVLEQCLGLEVSWQKDKQQILINDGRAIRLTIGGQVVLVDLEARLLSFESTVINDKAYISEEFLEQILKAKVKYNRRTEKIEIRY